MAGYSVEQLRRKSLLDKYGDITKIPQDEINNTKG